MNTPEDKPTLIDAKYSLSFAVRFSGVAVLLFSLFGVILFLLLNKPLGASYLDGISTLNSLREKLPVIVLTTGIIQAFVASLIVFILSLFWSHAVAGPLVRFRRYLDMIAQGKPTEGITFRKRDQLHSLAAAFSRMQSSRTRRRDSVEACRKRADQLIREYERLAEKKDADPVQLRVVQTALREVYEEMRSVFEAKEEA